MNFHPQSFNSLGLQSPRRYEIELSYEVLNIDFGQGAAKISDVKVGGQKKFLPSGPVRTRFARAGPSAEFFFKPPTLMAGSFASL